jgi:hypothetical protein
MRSLLDPDSAIAPPKLCECKEYNNEVKMFLKYPIIASASAIVPIAIKHVPDTQAHIDSTISIFLGAMIFITLMSGFIRSGMTLSLRSLIEIVFWAVFVVLAIHWIPQIWNSSKEVFVALCMAYLIFLFIERNVNSISYSLNSMLEGPVGFVTERIAQRFRKKFPEMTIANRLLDVPTKLNENDLNMTCIHEAGHALLYGILEQIPESLFVQINHKTYDDDHNSVSGFVGSSFREQAFPCQSFIEWRMLVNLGGLEAEKAILGQSTSGSRGDIKLWYDSAKFYFSCGFSEKLYFPKPEAEWEEKINQETLAFMLSKQRRVLELFFQENLSILKELADALREQNRLKAPDLEPYLKRVVRTDGILLVPPKFSQQI